MAPDTRSAQRLQQLRQSIEHWRRTRRKQGPMPAALWDEAAALAGAIGVCPVSRALGIGYDSLQKRVQGRAEPRAAAATAAPGVAPIRFVELSGAQFAGGTAAGGAVVEVTAADGAHLSVRLPSASALDVAALVRAFRAAHE